MLVLQLEHVEPGHPHRLPSIVEQVRALAGVAECRAQMLVIRHCVAQRREPIADRGARLRQVRSRDRGQRRNARAILRGEPEIHLAPHADREPDQRHERDQAECHEEPAAKAHGVVSSRMLRVVSATTPTAPRRTMSCDRVSTSGTACDPPDLAARAVDWRAPWIVRRVARKSRTSRDSGIVAVPHRDRRVARRASGRYCRRRGSTTSLGVGRPPKVSSGTRAVSPCARRRAPHPERRARSRRCS